MYNDFREYSDYLMHYGVPGMKWKHHHYVVNGPTQIHSSKSDSSVGDKTASVKQNYYDELDRSQHNNKQSGSRPIRKRYESLRNNDSNSHTTAKPNNRVSREYAAEYTYNTTGRSDNESVGRMHKRLQKYGDANPNANLSTRRSRRR